MLQSHRFRSETELERRSLDQFRYCKFNRSTPLPRTQRPADVQACRTCWTPQHLAPRFARSVGSGAGGRTRCPSRTARPLLQRFHIRPRGLARHDGRYFRSGRHLPKMVAVLDPVLDEGRAHATECRPASCEASPPETKPNCLAGTMTVSGQSGDVAAILL